MILFFKMWFKIVFLTVGCALASTFDVGGVISGNRMAGAPLGRSLGDGELDVEGVCSKAGMACQNCSLAVTCVSLPVGWLKVPQESCGEGLTCNAHLGRCSDQHVPECNVQYQKYHHSCEQVGMFPDAHDCKKFHICSPPEDVPAGRPADHRVAYCPRHYGYNPQIAQCSIPLKNGQCERTPIPSCSEVGQTGVVPGGPNHYYVCLIKHNQLHPQIFLCPHGWFFVDGFCRPEPSISTTEVIQEPSTEATEPSRMDMFFSTEKQITFKPDSFLADKFDLTNYETADDDEQRLNDSFESNEFW